MGSEEVEVANIDFTSRNVSVNKRKIYDNLRYSRIRRRFFFVFFFGWEILEHIYKEEVKGDNRGSR